MKMLFSLLEDWVPAALLAVMTLIVIVDVTGRYVLNFSFPGSAEVATALFIWLIFLGSAGAVRRMQHISIDTFTAMMPRAVLPWLQLVISSLVLVTSLYVAWRGIGLMNSSWHREIEVVGVSYFYIYLVVPISFGLMAIHSAGQLIDLMRNWQDAAALKAVRETDLEA